MKRSTRSSGEPQPVEERAQKRARREVAEKAAEEKPHNKARGTAEVVPARKTRSSAEAPAVLAEAPPLVEQRKTRKAQRKILSEEEEEQEEEVKQPVKEPAKKGKEPEKKEPAKEQKEQKEQKEKKEQKAGVSDEEKQPDSGRTLRSSAEKGKKREYADDQPFTLNRLPDTSFDMSPISKSFNSPGSVRSALIDSPAQSPSQRALKSRVGATSSPNLEGKSADSSGNLDSSSDSVKSKADTLFGDVHFEEKKRPIKRKFVREDKAAVKSVLEQQKKLFEEVDDFELKVEYEN